VRDNGIGMSRDEASRTSVPSPAPAPRVPRQAVRRPRKDSKLIGQFGVGFYSAFIVADRGRGADTRKAGEPAADGVRWASTGDGEFTVETVERAERGTRSWCCTSRKMRSEFADGAALAGAPLLRPHRLPGPLRKEGEARRLAASTGAGAVDAAAQRDQRRRVREFYQHIAHDFAEPLAGATTQVEGKREYTSLLYLPSRAPFDLYQREAPRGLKLYVQRVFIMDDAEQFLPLYLRFIRGVIDSADLPLNVSRELLQQDAHVDAIRAALTSSARWTCCRNLAKDDPEAYATFWGSSARAQGRPGRGLRQPRAHRRPAALHATHPPRRRRDGRWRTT
jgi:molecular chaperone HtpG